MRCDFTSLARQIQECLNERCSLEAEAFHCSMCLRHINLRTNGCMHAFFCKVSSCLLPYVSLQPCPLLILSLSFFNTLNCPQPSFYLNHFSLFSHAPSHILFVLSLLPFSPRSPSTDILSTSPTSILLSPSLSLQIYAQQRREVGEDQRRARRWQQRLLPGGRDSSGRSSVLAQRPDEASLTPLHLEHEDHILHGARRDDEGD